MAIGDNIVEKNELRRILSRSNLWYYF